MFISWLKLKKAGVQISFAQAFGMYIRRTLKQDFLRYLLASQEAKLGFTVTELETAYLCSGKIDALIRAAEMLRERCVAYRPSLLLVLAIHPVFDPLEFVDEFFKRIESKPELSVDELFNELLLNRSSADRPA